MQRPRGVLSDITEDTSRHRNNNHAQLLTIKRPRKNISLMYAGQCRIELWYKFGVHARSHIRSRRGNVWTPLLDALAVDLLKLLPRVFRTYSRFATNDVAVVSDEHLLRTARQLRPRLAIMAARAQQFWRGAYW